MLAEFFRGEIMAQSIIDYLNEANNLLSETIQSDREIRWLSDLVIDSLVRSIKRKKEFNGAVASTQQFKESKEWAELESFLNDWDITVVFSVPEGKEGGMWVGSKKTVHLSEPEKDDGLNKSIEKFLSKNMSEETFRNQIKSRYSETLIHELTHAFDDYRSKGEYLGKKKYSSDFEKKDYWLQQVEINARFGQTTKGVLDKKLSLDSGNGFEEYMRYFKKAIGKWEDMPDWVQKRLKGRMYKEYSELSNQEKDIILVNESWKTLNEFLMEFYDKKDVEPPEELMWASVDFRLKGDKAYTTNQMHTFSQLLKDAIKNPSKYEKEMKRLLNIIESIQNVLKKNPEAENVIKSYFKFSDKDIEDVKNADWMESVEAKITKTESIIGVDVGEELKQIENKYEEYLEDLTVFERKDSIEISMIKIKKEYRKQGYAKKIMNDILNYADKKNTVVVLSPEPQNNAISKANLEKFYRGLGFVPNKGKNKDFRYSAAMIREPRKMKESILIKEDESFFNKYIQFYYYDPDYNNEENDLEESLNIKPIKWSYPTEKELEDEFHEGDIDSLLLPSGYPKPEERKEAFEFFKKSLKEMEIDPKKLEDENAWRFRHKDYKSFRDLVKSYGGPKDPDSMVKKIQAGGELPMPVVIRKTDGALRLAGGATRVSIASLAGQKIKALVIDETDALKRRIEKKEKAIEKMIANSKNPDIKEINKRVMEASAKVPKNELMKWDYDNDDDGFDGHMLGIQWGLIRLWQSKLGEKSND